MRPAASPRITLAPAAIATFEAAGRPGGLRLRAGDEGRQAIDAAGIGDDRLRLVLRLRLLVILRLRTMVALAMFARLLIALIGLLVVALLVVTLVIALAVAVAHEGLLLRRLRNETRLLAEGREIIAVVLAVIAAGVDGLFAAWLLVLAELLLGRRDQAEIVLGMLVVVFGGNRVARGAGVARQLKIFFGDVGGSAADLDVGAVRFVDPGHRVLAASVVVIVVVVAVAHPLLVLTVSHVLPLIPALEVARITDC
ncbi:hypothetical protein AOQ71_14825 [Bradyrhizobium manausense]|uniref:Uncharacterized protein n=1 Tax=Bradyrhizobium manausense TaxID=989370 RepID=A0A0R3DTV2_9BRAD|nr:hypothetical protein AOQ71_14825 [Bradyrhizobium manausense]